MISFVFCLAYNIANLLPPEPPPPSRLPGAPSLGRTPVSLFLVISKQHSSSRRVSVSLMKSEISSWEMSFRVIPNTFRGGGTSYWAKSPGIAWRQAQVVLRRSAGLQGPDLDTKQRSLTLKANLLDIHLWAWHRSKADELPPMTFQRKKIISALKNNF